MVMALGSTRHETGRPLRWIAAPAVAVALAVGVWLTGGALTDDFKLAMGLTAAWFVLCGAAVVVVGIRARALRVPLVAGYLVTAVAIGGYLSWSTLHDRVADEDVVVGAPADGVPRAERARRNLQVASGTFESLEHPSEGSAAVVRLPSGRRVLTFREFSTAAGPDLRVRLVVGDTTDGASPGALDLGALKGNRGDQQYVLPAEADLRRHTTVVVWCRAFSAPFARAKLART
jgi:hypothetical protein